MGAFLIHNSSLGHVFGLVQDYIDSMEGATLSGRQASAYICDAGEELAALWKKLGALDSQEFTNAANITDKFSLV